MNGIGVLDIVLGDSFFNKMTVEQRKEESKGLAMEVLVKELP